MGNANMVCYAVENALKHHKLTANLLAFHAEYVQQRDIDEAYTGATTLNQPESAEVGQLRHLVSWADQTDHTARPCEALPCRGGVASAR